MLAERTFRNKGFFLECRVMLPRVVGLTIEVLSEHPRARVFLQSGADLMFFCMPVECFPLSCKHGRLWSEKRERGKEGEEYALQDSARSQV